MTRIIRLVGSRTDGASAIEYGLIAALVATAAIVGMEAAGGALIDMLGLVAAVIADAVASVS